MIPLPVGQWESENRNLIFAVGSVFGKPSLVKTPTKLLLKKNRSCTYYRVTTLHMGNGWENPI